MINASCVFISCAEEEYKRLSEALADEGTYNAVAFRYSADYYDPSQPTEEEDGSKDNGKQTRTNLRFAETIRLHCSDMGKVLHRGVMNHVLTATSHKSDFPLPRHCPFRFRHTSLLRV